MDVNFSELKRKQTSWLVQIKAGIFQWALGNWGKVKGVGEQSSPLGGSSSDRWTPVDLCLEGTLCPQCSQHHVRFSLGTSQ